MKTQGNSETVISQKPSEIKWIAILLAFTFMRAFMGLQLPTLEMYGGVNPNAWFTPWISDTILGLLVPYIIYLLLKKKGMTVWGTLIAYNAIGAFDYVHGLLAQWTDPLVPNGLMGTPALTYGSIGFSLLIQLLILRFLFRRTVIEYFK